MWCKKSWSKLLKIAWSNFSMCVISACRPSDTFSFRSLSSVDRCELFVPLAMTRIAITRAFASFVLHFEANPVCCTCRFLLIDEPMTSFRSLKAIRLLYSFIHSLVRSLVHSFILSGYSIAPLEVYYYLEALSTTALILCLS